MCFLSFRRPLRADIGLTKNPRLTGNRGFFGKIFGFRLENSSRDAAAMNVAGPSGHPSAEARALQAICRRDFHLIFERP
jgi:hypothetical protein